MAATPPSLPVSGTRRRLIQSQLTEIVSKKRMLESCSIKARRDDETKRRKCITGLWDLKLPSELMQEILSRLGLKANIRASLVCKTWFETAVSVRKLRPRPWLFYPLDVSKGPRLSFEGFQNADAPTETYILADPTLWYTRGLTFPGLKRHKFTFSRDGWLLVSMNDRCRLIFLLNPFTQERIYLPPSVPEYYCFAFSAAPTSSSCVVISIFQLTEYLAIMTWRPGETVWTPHRFENQIPNAVWTRCVLLNSMFYCLSTCGHIGVFDPSKATWNILSLNTCPAQARPKQPAFLLQPPLARPVLMLEHEGDIFVMSIRGLDEAYLCKLNLETMVWEEKRELGGLTVFASEPTCLTRAGLSKEDMNRIYPSHDGDLQVYYNLGPEKKMSHRPSTSSYLSNRIAWVDPPHNL